MRSKRFKALKKGMTWTIVFLLLFSSLPVISNGAASDENTLRDGTSEADAYLWTEGEDYLSVSPGDIIGTMNRKQAEESSSPCIRIRQAHLRLQSMK